jgi:hypothetical protein
MVSTRSLAPARQQALPLVTVNARERSNQTRSAAQYERGIPLRLDIPLTQLAPIGSGATLTVLTIDS